MPKRLHGKFVKISVWALLGICTIYLCMTTFHIVNTLTVTFPSRRCNKCNVQNFAYVNSINNTCQGDIFLLTVVVSHPNNTEARSAIRNTWASVTSHSGFNMKTVFILGKTGSIEVDRNTLAEANVHKDIVIMDLQEDYFKLTEKTLAALNWAKRSCSQFQYILKTDDDSFNNLRKHINFLASMGYPKRFVGGRCELMRTSRTKDSKWYTDPSEYEGTYLPIFCRGPAYLLSHETAVSFLQLSKNVAYFKLEDVYVTGFLREEYGIKTVDVPNMYSDPDQLGLCSMHGVTSVHYVKPRDIRELWNWISKPVNQPFYCIPYIDHYLSKVTVILLSVTVLLCLLLLIYKRCLN